MKKYTNPAGYLKYQISYYMHSNFSISWPIHKTPIRFMKCWKILIIINSLFLCPMVNLAIKFENYLFAKNALKWTQNLLYHKLYHRPTRRVVDTNVAWVLWWMGVGSNPWQFAQLWVTVVQTSPLYYLDPIASVASKVKIYHDQ